MSAPRHIMILASAGAGKTYALTNRFVALLAQGARPDRIVALTFTRKAAGEFLDEILNKLARAAQHEAEARRLAAAIERPSLSSRDFLAMLRAVTNDMHRLRLGTLDSFFARIARTFPLELGLAGDFEVLQEHSAQLERQRVLRRMFARAGELAEAQKEFIESFKRATFGAEEKQLGLRLDGFLDEHQEIFLTAPAATLWGDPARIWPDGGEWLQPWGDPAAARRALQTWVGGAAIGDKQRQRWVDFLAAAETWTPGIPPARELAYVLEKALQAWTEIIAGRAVLEFDRKRQELSPSAGAALADLTRLVIGGELARRLATTRGIHAVLAAYERIYHDAVRRSGKLTFGDVQRLLAPAGGAPVLSREGGGAGRLDIDFRLDAEIDHWLLDEFQDTSFGQWSILQNLIDEAVQDNSGRRSFFCVGDVKQAIFTWREGDPRLFREILNHYNAAAPGTIAEAHLVESWRSGPPLVEMINAVFGASGAIAHLFPGPAADAWNREWRTHVSALPERNGQAAWLLGEDESARWSLTLQLLQELRPLDRGLTCAVLVQSNATAAALADYLRREGGLPAVAEADLRVAVDNPLGAALLALIHVAAHPGDTLAWEHVMMSPLKAVMEDEGIAAREALSGRLLSQIHAEGFEGALEFWLERLEPQLDATDAFSRLRARQLVGAAALFDATGSCDVAEFGQFMRRYTARETDSATAIRVMTIHKSKGLGFDVVVLPDLEGNRIDERRDGLAVHKAADRSVKWILDLPPKLFWQRDEVLAGHVRAAEADACYEAFSLLYVALTRAKRGMYVITKAPAASVSRNYPRLLAETLGEEAKTIRIGALMANGVWGSGDSDWAAGMFPPVPRPAPLDPIRPLSNADELCRPRRASRLPSAEKGGMLNAAQLFAAQNRAGADFGTQAHALLAEVEWLEGSELQRREKAWFARGVTAEVLDQVLACMRDPALAGVWQKPAGPALIEIWRERAFEVILDGLWVTGVFDRVVVQREGAVVRVAVYDYKTDHATTDRALEAAVGRHRSQLHLYCRVAAILAGALERNVSGELVFLRARRRITLNAGKF